MQLNRRYLRVHMVLLPFDFRVYHLVLDHQNVKYMVVSKSESIRYRMFYVSKVAIQECAIGYNSELPRIC